MQNKLVLEELINRYREKKLAHAYLIETNNSEKALNDIKELVKILNCENDFIESCTKCNLCNLINKNNLPSLKIIYPDGASIKKSQIEELKKDFSSIPIYSKYNIYIILNAEKLNNSSANSMLKFIEEPSPGIIGFFITTNKDFMIDTIKSRCQTLTLKYDCKNIFEHLNLDEEIKEKYINAIRKYLTKIDNNDYINTKEVILSEFPERKDIEVILEIILELYYNTYLKNLMQPYDSNILKIYDIKDNLLIISKKMQIITKLLGDLSYNVNIELILDKFVIEMRGTHG